MNNLLGGKIIASGGFGCVFSPSLLCKNSKTKKRKTNTISKVMKSKYIYDEYNEIKQMLHHLKHINNYKNYFLIYNINTCKPKKFTKKDLKNFNNICTALPKDKITKNNINTKLDELMILNMPYGGIPIDDFIIKKKSMHAIKKLNNQLIKLLINGIIKMNNKHVFHNDIKDSNILIQVKNKKIYTRLIDWGLATYYLPYKNTPLPLVWKDRPFQYNSPFSNIIFSVEFIKHFTDFNINEKDITRDLLYDFINRYVYYWIKERGEGHIKLIFKIISIITDESPEYIICNYITDVVMYIHLKDKTHINIRHYLDSIYIHNVDKWGFVSSYYPILMLYYTNKDILSPVQNKCFDILKTLFFYIYTTSVHKIDTTIIVNELKKLTGYIDSQLKGNKYTKGLTYTRTKSGVTGKTRKTRDNL